ncbi:hypothetical protein Dcar01_02790 [Deinococcus carri]|uniref:HTH cro/C1-type domain-containing protein n=2 Tax=Deinococcus carri TaxID=1211323 RepID=A0ABP9WAI0_9DEIO
MAKHLLDKLEILVSDFAQATGIGRSTLQGYLAGRQDIASMLRPNAHRFLTGLGISDAEGWELFSIPEEKRPEWRSDRPPPLGHGPAETGERPDEQIVLEGPLFGEMSLPADVTIYYAPEGEGRFYLMQLADGTMFATSRSVAPAGGRVLGALTGARFGRSPTTAPPGAAGLKS